MGDKQITIEGDEAHHAIDVMRIKEGDDIVVFDGTGREFACSVQTVDTKARSVTARIVSVKNYTEGSCHAEMTLAQALPKKEKMDYIVEKATELGVSRIIPVLTERTIVRPDEGSSARKISRWRKIAVEAAKQSRRLSIPEIDGILTFRDLSEKASSYDLCLMACLTENTVPLKDALAEIRSGRILVLIGPEGDFTDNEIAAFSRNKNCRLVSLGPRVLKSDTAGLFVLSVLGYRFSG